jgi:hypothetical protein
MGESHLQIDDHLLSSIVSRHSFASACLAFKNIRILS